MYYELTFLATPGITLLIETDVWICTIDGLFWPRFTILLSRICGRFSFSILSKITIALLAPSLATQFVPRLPNYMGWLEVIWGQFNSRLHEKRFLVHITHGVMCIIVRRKLLASIGSRACFLEAGYMHSCLFTL